MVVFVVIGGGMVVGMLAGWVTYWFSGDEDKKPTTMVEIEDAPKKKLTRHGSVRVKSVKVGSGCLDLWNYHNVGVEAKGSVDSVWFPNDWDVCS